MTFLVNNWTSFNFLLNKRVLKTSNQGRKINKVEVKVEMSKKEQEWR